MVGLCLQICVLVGGWRGEFRNIVLKRTCFYLQAIIFYYGEKAEEMSKIMQKTSFFAQASPLFRRFLPWTIRLLLPLLPASSLHHSQVQQGQSPLHHQLHPARRPRTLSPTLEKTTGKWGLLQKGAWEMQDGKWDWKIKVGKKPWLT